MIDLQKSSNFEKNIENICTYYVKVHKKGHFLKKILAFAPERWYYTSVVLCLGIKLYFDKEVQLNGKM